MVSLLGYARSGSSLPTRSDGYRMSLGNVRELQNLVERAVIRSDSGVPANPFSAMDTSPLNPTPMNARFVVMTSVLADTFRDAQRALILETLRAADWIVGGPRGAAARLGLKRTTLIFQNEEIGDPPSIAKAGPHCRAHILTRHFANLCLRDFSCAVPPSDYQSS